MKPHVGVEHDGVERGDASCEQSVDTSEREDELWSKLFGPDAPRPRSAPTQRSVIFSGTDEELDRGKGAQEVLGRARPNMALFKHIPEEQRRAWILCSNRSGRRPHRVGLVTTWPDHLPGSVITVNPDQDLARIGEDWTVDCRCGMTHQVDGRLLRSAVEALVTSRRRIPTISVYDIERVK